MYENITKDGIYRIKLTASNPYCSYLLVKTYGNVQKKKKCCTLEDCRQQVEEWNSDYRKIDPYYSRSGFNALLNRKEKTREPRNYYSVFDRDGNLYMQGFGDEIAKRFGCKIKTICNIANTKGRKLNDLTGENEGQFEVVKTAQPQSEWIISEAIVW